MAIPVYQSTQTNGGFALSVTVNKPASTAIGDLLLATIHMGDATKSLTAPAGWTSIRNDFGGTSTNDFSYYRVADGSEGASFVWTATPAGNAVLLGAISRITGANTSTPINVSGGQFNSASASGTAPSVTTTLANCLLVHWAGGQIQSSSTPPGGMSEIFDVNGTTFGIFTSFAGEVENRPTAGATGSRANTWGSSGDNDGQLIAINEAVSVASTTGGNVGLSRTTTGSISFGCGPC